MLSIETFPPIFFIIFKNPILLSLSNRLLIISFSQLNKPTAIKKAAEEGSPGTVRLTGLKLALGEIVT
jgi:hypothetical protein